MADKLDTISADDELADGWKYQGHSCIHEPTVRDVLSCLTLVCATKAEGREP